MGTTRASCWCDSKLNIVKNAFDSDSNPDEKHLGPVIHGDRLSVICRTSSADYDGGVHDGPPLLNVGGGGGFMCVCAET